MSNLQISMATSADSQAVSDLVTDLFLELEPESKEEILKMNLPQLTSKLIGEGKIHAFLAVEDERSIGVITLNECAAIYAGGTFVEISEIYVKPEYRSRNIGKKLIAAVKHEAKQRQWKRIEVGAPSKREWPRTLEFYLCNGFKEIGPRLRNIV